nr:hypothetical protein [Paenibacillus ihumii]
MLRLGQEGALVAVHHGKNRGDAEEVFREIEHNGGKAFTLHPHLALNLDPHESRLY